MDWDSNFWGINIYNAKKCCSINNYKMDFNKKLSNSPFIIQALATDRDIEYINFLEDVGFRFVESKVNLVKRVQHTSEMIEYDLYKNVKIEDIKEYKNQFYNLYGEVSRFSFLDKDMVNEFYYKWVYKSIKAELDDNCVGYYIKGILEGFITYKITEQKLIIGLVGVFSDYQGKKISQKLLCYINEIALKNKCNEICVSTQGKNIKAINAYIKSGFLIYDINHWYYLKEGV